MKKFELPAVRMQDLINVLAATSPGEIEKAFPQEAIKTISRVEKIYTDLEKANTEYVAMFEKYLEPIKKVTEDFRKKIDAKRDEMKGATDAEIAKAIETLVSEGNTLLKKTDEDSAAAVGKKEMDNKVVSAELSDEKLKTLIEVFEKMACSKFTGGEHAGKAPLVAIYDALTSAKEV